jgi:hypothetical protein
MSALSISSISSIHVAHARRWLHLPDASRKCPGQLEWLSAAATAAAAACRPPHTERGRGGLGVRTRGHTCRYRGPFTQSYANCAQRFLCHVSFGRLK